MKKKSLYKFLSVATTVEYGQEILIWSVILTILILERNPVLRFSICFACNEERVIIPLNFSILFKGRNAKRSIYLQTLQHIKEVLSRS